MYTFVKEIDTTNNKDFKAIILTSDSNIKNSCITVDKEGSLKQGQIYACISKDTSRVSYWIKKDIKFLINPFDYSKRYFDYSTINVIKDNNITPVIMLDEISKINKFQVAGFLRNAFIFSDFCRKNNLPIIIDSSQRLSMKTSPLQEYYNYLIFGYSIEQAKMFNKVVFEGLYEKEI